MPIVSIIIPAYNCAPYIEMAVRSAAVQTEPDLEIIVIDDGSIDGTLGIAMDLASADSRIKVFSQSNSGKPSIARNVGLSKASGEYVCFLDGDDIFHPEKLCIQKELLDSHPNLAAAFHDVKFVSSNGKELPGSYLGNSGFMLRAKGWLTRLEGNKYICSSDFYRFMSLNYAAIHTSSIMIRRSILDHENLRFAEDLLVGEDTEFWWSVAIGREIGFIDAILSYYRQRPDSVTKNLISYHQDLIKVHIRNFNRGASFFSAAEKSMYRKRIASIWSNFGYVYMVKGQHLEARNCYVESWKWYRNLNTILYYMKTMLPVTVMAWLRGSDA